MQYQNFARTVFLVTTAICLNSVLAFSKSDTSGGRNRKYKNHITVSNGYRYFTDKGYYNRFFRRFQFFLPPFSTNIGEQISFSYERSIYRSFGVEAQYNFWIKKKLFWTYAEMLPSSPQNVKGWVTHRWAYKQFDLLLSYKLNVYRKHSLSISGGSSIANGWDTEIDSIYVNPAPPHDAIIYGHDTKNLYWGNVLAVKNDYNLFKGKCSIGLNVEYRNYMKMQTPMYFYGMHGTYHF